MSNKSAVASIAIVGILLLILALLVHFNRLHIDTIKDKNRQINLLKEMSVKKTALMMGYADGLIDGLESYMLLVYAGESGGTWSKLWKQACKNSTNHEPLMSEIHKAVALEYLNKIDMFGVPESNYMVKLIQHKYKEANRTYYGQHK